jgi:SPW repeat
MLLLCVIGLTMATWAAVSSADGVATWKFCFSVTATIFLGLAALTPRALWALGVRLTMSGWLMTAPWLLAFSDLPLARWSHLIAGLLIAVWSTPYFLYRTAHLADKDAPFTWSLETATGCGHANRNSNSVWLPAEEGHPRAS